jgi:phage antirepressor YoqD-like protein
MNKEKKCLNCNHLFLSVRKSKIYCSDSCRYKAFQKKKEKDCAISLPDVANALETPKHSFKPLDKKDLQILPSEPSSKVHIHTDKAKLNNDKFNVKNKQYKSDHWKTSDSAVTKVTQHFLTLLKSTLKLASYPSIDHKSLMEVTTAYGNLLKSNYFHCLPSNYPYTKAIFNYHEKFQKLTQSTENANEILFKLTDHRREEIEIIIKEIGDFVHPVKFSMLKYTI